MYEIQTAEEKRFCKLKETKYESYHATDVAFPQKPFKKLTT
jgi:hypothetical protein